MSIRSVRRVLPLLLLAPLLGASPAMAQFVSGNKLMQHLEANSRALAGKARNVDFQEQAFAAGYIAGIFDTGDGSWYCSSEQMQMRQIVAVVKKYMDERPAEWSNSADTLVRDALKQSFPCPAKQ